MKNLEGEKQMCPQYTIDEWLGGGDKIQKRLGTLSGSLTLKSF